MKFASLALFAAFCLNAVFTASAGRDLLQEPEAEPEPAAAAEGDLPTLMQIGEDNVDHFSILLKAVKAAGLDQLLHADEPIVTVFAPNDEAFQAVLDTLGLSEEELDQLPNLVDIIEAHAVMGKVMAADLNDGDEIMTISGVPLKVKIDGDTVMINDAKVIEPFDVEASNGVIHAIDKVLSTDGEEAAAGDDAEMDMPADGEKVAVGP